MNTEAPLVDIGANLVNKAFASDMDEVLARAASSGVSAILVTGTSTQVSRRARELVIDRRATTVAPRLYATAGIHPHHASAGSPEALDEIRELAGRPEVVAVGECGLDYNRNYSPRDAQLRCFEAQLELAAEIGKPVFLHERDAAEDFAKLLQRHRNKLTGGVVHCFTGDRSALEQYLALDLHIGFTGWLCDERRGTHLRELSRLVPAGRLLIETDAPYILPRDLPGRAQNRRNEPAFLLHIAKTIATCRNESLEALARHTTESACALFGLPVAD
jgi:TatD DNase family protein